MAQRAGEEVGGDLGELGRGRGRGQRGGRACGRTAPRPTTLPEGGGHRHVEVRTKSCQGLTPNDHFVYLDVCTGSSGLVWHRC